MSRRQLLRAASAGALLASTGSQAQGMASPGVTDRQILIGQSMALQGGKNDYGVAIRDGVEAALRQINGAGGVAGRQLVLRVLDDEGQATRAEANARKLIDEGVFILFGSVEGGPSNAVMKAAADKRVPLFGPMAGSPTLRLPFQPLVFPVRAAHRDEFMALLAHAKRLGMQRSALLHADTDVGRQHLANAGLAARGLGMAELLGLPAGGDVSDAQIDALVRKLSEQRIEMVFNHGSAALFERLIRRTRAAGLNTQFYGVNSGSTQLARRLGAMAHGMVFTQVVPSPWERKTALTREYQAAFRAAFSDQDFSYGSLEGYLTTRALAEALKRPGRKLSRASLLQALADASFDIAGFKFRYTATEHTGSGFVDTAIVDRDGRFRH
ncbi:ABC transporter substrate-binding protein [Aquabacterium sp. OR-4]|uniref:ABC transporter substrate-binding protein n=1 Tax=Aquabacterium sp. OR-4 TaxID=2978127 RepID=UPI0021B2E436|nr:ABC transporter substrate-binding protein [Aquabacterium sp. OR-4]MDT7836064.1 ABC transporter substrate-binding protein [Aquabacterium sp. OR-4]